MESIKHKMESLVKEKEVATKTADDLENDRKVFDDKGRELGDIRKTNYSDLKI